MRFWKDAWAFGYDCMCLVVLQCSWVNCSGTTGLNVKTTQMRSLLHTGLRLSHSVTISHSLSLSLPLSSTLPPCASALYSLTHSFHCLSTSISLKSKPPSVAVFHKCGCISLDLAKMQALVLLILSHVIVTSFRHWPSKSKRLCKWNLHWLHHRVKWQPFYISRSVRNDARTDHCADAAFAC